ncbi:MAG: MMPL family transporter [Candidatus Omnitrophica bacterium]|nr:MMPL family transporter [Candidatus Omnitrophota bacterium]
MVKFLFSKIKKSKLINRLIAKYSWQLLLFFGLTIVALLILFLTVDLTPHVDGDFFFSSDEPKFQYDKMISKVFPDQEQVIISVTGDVYSSEYIERLDLFTEVLSAVSGVSSVKGLTRGPKNLDDALVSPLWKRLLVSEDGKSSNLIVLLEDVSPQEIVPKFEEAMDLFATDYFQLKIAGVPYVVENIRRNLLRDFRFFSAMAFLIFGIVIMLIFRSPKILLGTLLSCINACVLTLIISNLFGIRIGILTVNLVTIIFVLALSHIVFLTYSWRYAGQNLELSPPEFTAKAVKSTFTASFWCMVTTLLGFLSLLFVQAKPLRELGVTGSIGTLAAIAVVYGVYPLFLKSMRPVKIKAEETNNRKVSSYLLGHSNWVIIGILFLFIVGLLGLSSLNTDPSLLSYFKGKTELRQGLEYIDRNGGSSPFKLVLRDAGGGKLTDNIVYKRLWRLQEALEEDRSVGSIVSLPVIMAEGSRAPLAFLLNWESLLKTMGQEKYHRIARSFVTDDRISGYFFIRMKEADRKASRIMVIERIKKIIHEHGFIPEMQGGVYVLQGELSKLVASSLVYGLVKLILFFIIIAWIVSRCFGISLAMVLSLCIPPVCMLGVVGLMKVPLDIISAPAANVAIAMGIDSMIHMAIFVRRRMRKGVKSRIAWKEAQVRLWEPIVGSVFIISAGFGIFGISSFPPTQRFGLSIVLGTIVAALAAIFVLPAIAEIPVLKRVSSKNTSAGLKRVLPYLAVIPRALGKLRRHFSSLLDKGMDKDVD